MRADLHCHSRCSDGSMKIEELLPYAKRVGLEALAITDHDTLAGIPRAEEAGRDCGVTVLAGVEIACREPLSGKAAHLLCYLPERPDALEEMLGRTLQRRSEAGWEMVRKVQEQYPVTDGLILEAASMSEAVYRVHISRALCELGVADRAFGALFQELLGEHGSCRVRFPYPTLDEALEQVRAARGVAVLAHPGQQDHLALCERLAAEGRIQGFEAVHPSNPPEVQEKLLSLCRRYGLIATGGTDFHGSFSPHPRPLGSCLAPPEAVSEIVRMKNQWGKPLL